MGKKKVKTVTTVKTYAPRAKVSAYASKIMNPWKSLASAGHIYRHICRAAPFFLTDNFKAAGATVVSYPFYGQLSSVAQSSTFTSLYDQYRIKKIKWTFYPVANFNAMVSGAVDNYNLGLISYALDYDSVTNLTEAEMYEYADLKTVPYGKKFSITLKPKVLMPDTAGTASVGVTGNNWIDCTHNGVKHLGVHVFIGSHHPTATTNLYNVVSEYHIEFRTQK